MLCPPLSKMEQTALTMTKPTYPRQRRVQFGFEVNQTKSRKTEEFRKLYYYRPFHPLQTPSINCQPCLVQLFANRTMPLLSYFFSCQFPAVKLLPNTITDVLSSNGKTDPMILTTPIINTTDSVQLNRLSTELSKDRIMERTLLEWAELEITTRLEATGR